MRLMELIYQEAGITKEVNKFCFGGGYNLIDTSRGLSLKTVEQIVKLSLFPVMKPKRDDSLKSGRIGATFSHSKETYRFVRDLEKDACSFSRYNEEKKDFDELSRNPSFIEKAFEDTFKLDMAVYDKLFAFDEDFSKRWFRSYKSGRQDGYFEALDGGGVKEKVKKLRSLEEEKKRIESMKSCEFELDGLQNKLFETSDRIQKVKNKGDEIPFILNELGHYRDFESIEDFPKDIEKRLKEYDLQKEKKGGELAGLDNKMNDLVNRLAGLKIEPVNKDKAFLASAAGALACFGLSVFLKKFLVFSLVGFVVFILLSAWRLILYFKRKDEEVNLNAEMKSLTENKNLLEKRFEIETSIVKKFLERTGSETASDALDSMKRRLQILENLQDAKRGFEDMKKSLRYEEALKDQEALKKQIKAMEEKLRSFPSVSMEPNDLDLEIERLRGEVGEHAFEPLAAAQSDPYSFLTDNAALILKTDKEKIAGSLKDSYTANLKILSGGYFTGVQWAGSSLTGFEIGGKDKKGLNELSEEEHCLAFFPFQFTILQMLTRVSEPVLAFGYFDGTKPKVGKERMVQALAHLAKSCQVIHVV